MALSTLNCYGQPVYVEAPDVRPLPYGLFSVAEIVEDNSAHWQQGVEWESASGCTMGLRYACPTCNQNNGGTAPAKTYTNGTTLVAAAPFTVYGSFRCSPIGNWDRGMERAARALQDGEERAVEAEIAVGGFHSGNSFVAAAAVDVTPVPGTAISITAGVALLEQYLGVNNHGQGVLHMSRREATFAASSRLLREDTGGPMLLTKLGTPVAAGGGYLGVTGPNATAAVAPAHWIYATGVPYIRRTSVFMTPPNRANALDQRNNNFAILAERTYAVNWDCVTAAVLVTTI